jgi:hypothetical protein
MITTVFYRAGNNEKRINFMMPDAVEDRAIRKAARRIITERFPEIKGRITRYEWRY